jgi:predicted translin family RNA/ssDNA-binding protein
MSKNKSSEIVSQCKSDVNLSWNDAIREAERQIAYAKSKIAQMRQGIKAFKAMRDGNEPFPGENRLLGQDSDL